MSAYSIIVAINLIASLVGTDQMERKGIEPSTSALRMLGGPGFADPQVFFDRQLHRVGFCGPCWPRLNTYGSYRDAAYFPDSVRGVFIERCNALSRYEGSQDRRQNADCAESVREAGRRGLDGGPDTRKGRTVCDELAECRPAREHGCMFTCLSSGGLRICRSETVDGEPICSLARDGAAGSVQAAASAFARDNRQGIVAPGQVGTVVRNRRSLICLDIGVSLHGVAPRRGVVSETLRLGSQESDSGRTATAQATDGGQASPRAEGVDQSACGLGSEARRGVAVPQLGRWALEWWCDGLSADRSADRGRGESTREGVLAVLSPALVRDDVRNAVECAACDVAKADGAHEHTDNDEVLCPPDDARFTFGRGVDWLPVLIGFIGQPGDDNEVTPGAQVPDAVDASSPWRAFGIAFGVFLVVVMVGAVVMGLWKAGYGPLPKAIDDEPTVVIPMERRNP